MARRAGSWLRQTIARACERQPNTDDRGGWSASSRLACHLEDWGVQARGTRGSKSPPRGSSGQAAEPLEAHYRPNPFVIQVKLISRRWPIKALCQVLSDTCADEMRHI